IGVIPQALTSDLDLTVDENLNIYAKLYDVPAQREERISTNCWNWWISPSGAMRRRKPYRAACGVGWRSRADWCIAREFSFLTSRRPVSTRFRASPSGKC